MSSEEWFDDVSKAIATRVSRSRVLQWSGGVAGAALATLVPWRGALEISKAAAPTLVATRVFAAESRPNNNCTFVHPDSLLTNGARFRIPLSMLAPASPFNALRLDLQGYGCCTASNTVQVADLQLVTVPGLAPGRIMLPVLPQGGWTSNFGVATAPCTPPNPVETGFGQVRTFAGPGVQFSSASTTCACCGCIARSKAFVLPHVQTDEWQLIGFFFATRGANDTYSVASMRVNLLSV